MCIWEILVGSENAFCSLAAALGSILLKVQSEWHAPFERNSAMARSTSFRIFKLLRCSVFLALLLSGTACCPVQAQDTDLVFTRVAEAQLDSLASRIAENIKKNNRDSSPAKVLIFDFTWEAPGISSRLGTILADRFSEMLRVRSNGVEVMDRKVFKDYLNGTWTRIEDFRTDSVYLLVAEYLGATEIVRANLVEEGTHQLNVLAQVAGSEPPFSDQARFVITEDMEDMLSQPTPSYSKALDPIPPEPGVLVMGTKGAVGVSWPMCITCPDPKFSDLARRAKVNGTVSISAVITTSGQVTAIYIAKPLPFGLTQAAINSVRDWKFNPAMKDGNPVSVRVDITVTFRTL
jgi:TonB family protein